MYAQSGNSSIFLLCLSLNSLLTVRADVLPWIYRSLEKIKAATIFAHISSRHRKNDLLKRDRVPEVLYRKK
jgi:hypothetical protein